MGPLRRCSVSKFSEIIKQLGTMPSTVLVLAGVLLFTLTAYAQIPNVNNMASTPHPGDGHDYIKFLSETVNPANGSVSVRIEAPAPQQRGALNAPYEVFSYDSDGVHIPGPNLNGGAPTLWTTTFLA